MSNSTVRIARRGMMIVLSSPSGAGKTTLARRLIEAGKDEIVMSVSVTTRARRTSEIEGRDYVFVGDDQYKRMVKAGDLLEHARVFGNWYGTPRAPVERALAEGRDVLFDIDWQGAKQLHKSARADLVRIFVLPPSLAELEKRLSRRAEDAPEVVASRMAKALDELSHWEEYDYVVVNDDVERAFHALTCIVAAERARRTRQTGLAAFVEQLTGKK